MHMLYRMYAPPIRLAPKSGDSLNVVSYSSYTIEKYARPSLEPELRLELFRSAVRLYVCVLLGFGVARVRTRQPLARFSAPAASLRLETVRFIRSVDTAGPLRMWGTSDHAKVAPTM